MKDCSSCGANNWFRYGKEIDATTIGGGLLPKLESGLFSAPKVRPVICGSCGLVQFFASEASLAQLEGSTDWEKA